MRSETGCNRFKKAGSELFQKLKEFLVAEA